MSVDPFIRMGTGALSEADTADWLLRHRGDVGRRIADQVWLRAILMEQRKRTALGERDAYDERADAILALLDPPLHLAPSVREEAR
jgi:hypothetical protein